MTQQPLWPNQKTPVDGIVPLIEISQDPDLLEGLEDHDLEMEG